MLLNAYWIISWTPPIMDSFLLILNFNPFPIRIRLVILIIDVLLVIIISFLDPILFYGALSSSKQYLIAVLKFEYWVVANITTELFWIQSFLRETGLLLSSSPPLWYDNISTTYLTVNLVFNARTKHIEIDFHFISDLVASNAFHVKFISLWDQLVNTFTKPLSNPKFSLVRSTLNVFEPLCDYGGLLR